MIRCFAAAVAFFATLALAVGCAKNGASATDAAAPVDATDAAAPVDATDAADTAPTDGTPMDMTSSVDRPAGQCPRDLPVDAASCSIPTTTCPYDTACGERDFLCFAFEIGAPAKWICLGNCTCDAGAD
ncbi:MAG TPA: hypothetical protein VIF57_00535 [Polyangia bacterium]